MKRYFDLHDKKQTAMLTIEEGSPASKANVEDFKEFFDSEDVRELISSSEYRRLTCLYEQIK